MKSKIMLWICILLLALPLALALGIRPAQTTIISEETPTLAGQFWIVNNEEQPLELLISAKGPLQNYIDIKNREVTIGREEGSAPVYFEINLPPDLPPGESISSIVVEQKLTSTEQGFVAAKLVLNHKVIVHGPIPDKYVIARLNFHESGDTIRIVSEVENKGKKGIDSIQTAFYVNDREQKEHVLETEKTTLKPSENKLLEARLDRKLLERGEFEVSAITTYDEQQVEVVKSLILGRPEVDVTYFDRYFIAYKINQYTMDLLNRWNRDVRNVFVDVEVSKDGRKVDSFRTRSLDLQAEMAQRITDYLDAKDKGPGRYTFDLKVNFWGLVRNEQKDFRFESEFVSEDDKALVERQAPILGQAASSGAGGRGGTIVLWVLLGILLGGALMYVLYRFTHRGEYEGGEEAW